MQENPSQHSHFLNHEITLPSKAVQCYILNRILTLPTLLWIIKEPWKRFMSFCHIWVSTFPQCIVTVSLFFLLNTSGIFCLCSSKLFHELCSKLPPHPTQHQGEHSRVLIWTGIIHKVHGNKTFYKSMVLTIRQNV